MWAPIHQVQRWVWTCLFLFSLSFLWPFQFSCHILPSCDSSRVVNIHKFVKLSPWSCFSFSQLTPHSLALFHPPQYMQVIISVVISIPTLIPSIFPFLLLHLNNFIICSSLSPTPLPCPASLPLPSPRICPAILFIFFLLISQARARL